MVVRSRPRPRPLPPQARPLATEGPGTNAVRYSQQQLDFLARKQQPAVDGAAVEAEAGQAAAPAEAEDEEQQQQQQQQQELLQEQQTRRWPL